MGIGPPDGFIRWSDFLSVVGGGGGVRAMDIAGTINAAGAGSGRITFDQLVEVCVQRLEWYLAVEVKASALENECIALEETLQGYEAMAAGEVDCDQLIESTRARLEVASTALTTVYLDPVDVSPAALRQVPMDMVCEVVAKQVVASGAPVTPQSIFHALIGVAERWNGRPLAINTQAASLYAGTPDGWATGGSGFPWKVEKP